MNYTILIVEDHDTVRASLRDWLAAVFPAARFVDSATGEEAVRLAREWRPTIVLMDIGLPQMNGIETTRQIMQAAPQTKVVILTIHEAAAYQQAAEAAGAAAFVPKRKMYADLLPVLRTLTAE